MNARLGLHATSIPLLPCLQCVKPGDEIFVGQYLFTGSETTSVWLEVVESQGENVVALVKNSATLAGKFFTAHANQVCTESPLQFGLGHHWQGHWEFGLGNPRQNQPAQVLRCAQRASCSMALVPLC